MQGHKNWTVKGQKNMTRSGQNMTGWWRWYNGVGSIVADYVHSLMAATFWSSNGYLKHDKAPLYNTKNPPELILVF